MGFIDSFTDKFKKTNTDDTFDTAIKEDESIEMVEDAPKLEKVNNVINFPSDKSQSKLKVMVFEPNSFEDVKQIGPYLKSYEPVVLNFETTNPNEAKRIIDFISGTVYALEGDIEKVGKNVFLCAPNNVNVEFSEEINK